MLDQHQIEQIDSRIGLHIRKPSTEQFGRHSYSSHHQCKTE